MDYSSSPFLWYLLKYAAYNWYFRHENTKANEGKKNFFLWSIFYAFQQQEKKTFVTRKSKKNFICLKIYAENFLKHEKLKLKKNLIRKVKTCLLSRRKPEKKEKKFYCVGFSI